MKLKMENIKAKARARRAAILAEYQAWNPVGKKNYRQFANYKGDLTEARYGQLLKKAEAEALR